MMTVSKKPLFLALPHLGPLSFQTRTNLRKSLGYSQWLQIEDFV